MLNLPPNIAPMSRITAGAMAYLWLLHRIWSRHERRKDNDLVGWQITVIGTTYAVIIGFMLYAVWTNYACLAA